MSSSAFLPEDYSPLQESGFSHGALSGFRESDGDHYALWENVSRLTLSLAGDGTNISNHQSSLFSSFQHMLNAQQLEQTILRAFQTWARHSNVNVGLVADSNEDFGTRGSTQNDERFGDVRVGAIPMANDVFAVAVPHNELLSGTWAGDILFNSDANFTDADQFYAVALHEIGHVLGLDHSQDPTSVMHPTAMNLELNPDDIQNLQLNYGARALDQYDLGIERNDSFETATKIRNTGSIDGIIPLVAFGDIEDGTDKDFYFVQPNSDYVGDLTFRVVSNTVSLMRAKLTLFDENGGFIDSVTETSTTGSDISFQLLNIDPEQEYFVSVEAIGDPENQFGSYALITTFDQNLVQGTEWIPVALRRNYGSLSQGEIQELFLSDLSGPIHADLHTNDTPLTATPLEPSPTTATHNDYRIQASIEDATDIDYYSFEANGPTLNARINALETMGLISDIEVFDSNLNPIAGNVLVNGNGELLVEFDGLISGDEYFVSVVADRPGSAFGYGTGNYDLNLAFRESTVTYETLGMGRLSHHNRTETHTLYVARSQLFHFALTGLNESYVPNATIWMTIYDENGDAKYRVATRPNETRTSQSVLIRPGSYSIKVHVNVPAPLNRRNRIRSVPILDYRIDGLGISEPTGPQVIDPSDDPFSPCDKTSSNFCYPNDRHSPDPFIVVNEDEVVLPGPPTNPNWMDSNRWYWTSNWLGG